MDISNFVELSADELLYIDGGKEGDAWRAVGSWIGKAVACAENAVDAIKDAYNDFIDGVKEGWEKTRKE